MLLSLFARLPKMVPATTLLVLASASSLWLQRRRPANDRMAGMLGFLVCGVASFMLACHLIGAAPPPFLLSRPGAQSAFSFSSPVTAAMFSVLGIALAGLARDRHVTLAQLAAMAVLLLSVLNLAGCADVENHEAIDWFALLRFHRDVGVVARIEVVLGTVLEW